MDKLFKRYAEISVKLSEKESQLAAHNAALALCQQRLAEALADVKAAEFGIADLSASRDWYKSHLEVTAKQIASEMGVK